MNGSKKLLILYILDVLQKYSDAAHPILQSELTKLIETHHGLKCERKSVARNITSLREYGYDIAYDKGYYLRERNFDESELRLLIDSVMASRHIPVAQAKTLIEKLESLANVYFGHRMRHVCNVAQLPHSPNRELFYSVDVLDEAIDRGRQVRFYYNKYGSDLKLHHLHDFKATVNPYQMVVANGRYYLVGNNEQFDNVIHWRLDLITEIELLSTPSKPMEKVKGLEHGLDLPSHMAEHNYMFSGESVHVKMRVQTETISDVVDWFGTNIRVTKQDGDWCLVELKANANAMFFWAMQYGGHTEILAPEKLRGWVKDCVKGMEQMYNREIVY